VRNRWKIIISVFSRNVKVVWNWSRKWCAFQNNTIQNANGSFFPFCLEYLVFLTR